MPQEAIDGRQRKLRDSAFVPGPGIFADVLDRGMPMPRRKKRSRTKQKEQYALITVRVDRYDARASASINHHAAEPQHALSDPDEEPLYELITQLEIVGTATDPESRAGEICELTIYGEDSPSSRVFAKLKDVHLRDKHDVRQYRKYYGRHIPVYWTPRGVGTLDKVRGEPRWRGVLFVRPDFVRDLLFLLSQGRELFLSLHETKVERRRWLQSVTLQTTDPAEE